MEEYGVSAAIFNSLILMNSQYIEAVYADLMNSFGLFFRAFFVLYTVFTGYKWYKANSSFSAYDLIISYIIVASVYSCVLEMSWFYDVVIETTLNLTLDLSSFFISATNNLPLGEDISNVHELFKHLDATVLNFFNALENMAPKGVWLTNAWRYVCFVVAMLPLFMTFLAMYVAFFAIFGMAFFSMFIFFIVGGICMLFAAFPETRHIFYTWLRGLLNYMLLAVFAAVIMGICGKGIGDAVAVFTAQSEAAPVFVSDAYLKILVWCAFCLAMILKAPDFAAHLTGSMAGSTTGIAGGMSASASALGGGLWTASKMTGIGAAKGAWDVGKKGASRMAGGAMNALDVLKAKRNAK